MGRSGGCDWLRPSTGRCLFISGPATSPETDDGSRERHVKLATNGHSAERESGSKKLSRVPPAGHNQPNISQAYLRYYLLKCGRCSFKADRTRAIKSISPLSGRFFSRFVNDSCTSGIFIHAESLGGRVSVFTADALGSLLSTRRVWEVLRGFNAMQNTSVTLTVPPVPEK